MGLKEHQASQAVLVCLGKEVFPGQQAQMEKEDHKGQLVPLVLQDQQVNNEYSLLAGALKV